MKVIGLTGGIGSGKSTVTHIFADLGITIIDTDIISRQLVEPHKPAYQEILQHFGHDILLSNQCLDRAALKKRILNDDTDRLTLEAILHPLIQQEVKQQLKLATGHYCIVVIPLLVEKANYPMLDRILVIDTPKSLQIERVTQRDELDNSSIEKLIALQATREERLAVADDVILNDQGLAKLNLASQQMHDKYMKL